MLMLESGDDIEMLEFIPTDETTNFAVEGEDVLKLMIFVD
jgi:hypothetical protein